jgi:glycosyltransferase involved in cell wall biosynthesis
MAEDSLDATAVSAIIPVYNGGEFAAEAIESVYAQTALPGEVIVVDDGSTDNTPSVLKRFEGRPGFISIRKPNGGEASARNAGVARARGEYIAFLDHDDLWRPHKLERQLGEFDPAWGMSFTGYELTTDGTSRLDVYETWDPDPQAVIRVLERFAVLRTPSTWLIRRDELTRMGPFENVSPFGTDWLMALRFVAAGNKVGYVSEALTEKRLHGQNLSSDEPGFFDCACAVFDRYGDRRLRAWRRLIAAEYAHEHGDRGRARKRLLEAAKIRPTSVRPGWVRLLL